MNVFDCYHHAIRQIYCRYTRCIIEKKTPRFCHYHNGHNRNYPNSSHLLGQRWHFVASIVGPTSFCSKTQRSCQRCLRCWSNFLSSTSPAIPNVMPTSLFQTIRWINIRSTWFKSSRHLQFLRIEPRSLTLTFNNDIVDINSSKEIFWLISTKSNSVTRP